jgi:hypothetical protein
LERVPLEVIDCPDRRLTRAAVECVARELADGETEVSVLLPDRKYKGIWHRVLHDKTADAILEEVSRLPHANVTTVPFHLEQAEGRKVALSVLVARRSEPARAAGDEPPLPVRDLDLGVERVPGTSPIAEVRWRSRVSIAGRVRSMRVAPLHDAPTLELVLVDRSGGLSIVFLGRRGIAGVDVGSRMQVEGTVGVHKGRLALLNPKYRLLP